MEINKREFVECENGEYIFSRETSNNMVDIAGSAALALHKAIIGICD